MSAAPLLQVEGLSRQFGGLHAVERLTFDVFDQEIVSIIGPNGAGKTTVFNVITNLYPPTTGTIRVAGSDLSDVPPHRVPAFGVARTFQNLRIFPNLTVKENVLVGQTLSRRASLLTTLFRLPSYRLEEAALSAAADALLDLLGLNAVASQLARNLAYGYQRRVEIARALAVRPRLLLLDEPAAGMNPAEVDGLGLLVRRLRDAYKQTILLVEHHMSLVMSVSDRVIVMDEGRKIMEGTPQQVRADERVIRAYLGTGVAEA
jgi:branched-chain amino acid transport system ATP-binding protein